MSALDAIGVLAADRDEWKRRALRAGGRSVASARLVEQRAKVLWCVHLLGPDELVAMGSYDAAEKYATALSDFLHGPEGPKGDVLCLPIVAIWPWSEDAHRAALVDATKAGGAK